MRLRRYWFKFEHSRTPHPVNLGCGVTAYDKRDAIQILATAVFPDMEIPRILQLIEDVDISTFDAKLQKHVIGNMGLSVARGVWFPGGYDGGA